MKFFLLLFMYLLPLLMITQDGASSGRRLIGAIIFATVVVKTPKLLDWMEK